jgi:hypothetical protein
MSADADASSRDKTAITFRRPHAESVSSGFENLKLVSEFKQSNVPQPASLTGADFDDGHYRKEAGTPMRLADVLRQCDAAVMPDQ